MKCKVKETWGCAGVFWAIGFLLGNLIAYFLYGIKQEQCDGVEEEVRKYVQMISFVDFQYVKCVFGNRAKQMAIMYCICVKMAFLKKVVYFVVAKQGVEMGVLFGILYRKYGGIGLVIWLGYYWYYFFYFAAQVKLLHVARVRTTSGFLGQLKLIGIYILLVGLGIIAEGIGVICLMKTFF